MQLILKILLNLLTGGDQVHMTVVTINGIIGVDGILAPVNVNNDAYIIAGPELLLDVSEFVINQGF